MSAAEYPVSTYIQNQGSIPLHVQVYEGEICIGIPNGGDFRIPPDCWKELVGFVESVREEPQKAMEFQQILAIQSQVRLEATKALGEMNDKYQKLVRSFTWLMKNPFKDPPDVCAYAEGVLKSVKEIE